MYNTRRIVFNTAVIYIQSIVSMLITLYTSRVILLALGVLDYGVYNVVGGVIAMFGFINNSMAVSTQRHMAFELGKNNQDAVRKLFSASIILHIAIAIMVLVLAETVGLWFFENYINIPFERKEAARWIYHFATFAFMLNIINVPYQAALNSYENMLSVALISLLYSVMVLLISFLIVDLPFDKLKAYSILILLINVIISINYFVVCKKKYPHMSLYFVKEVKLYKELLGFAGWNLSAALAMLGKNQGLAIILNLFIGPIINAAYGIANQINSAVNNFSQAIIRAVNPQITKSYSSGNYNMMFVLICQSSRIGFLFLLILTIPIIYEPVFVLSVWLKVVPAYAPIFTVLILINALIEVFSFPLMTVAQATGNIKYYQLSNTTLLLLNLPISYYLLKKGFNPYVILYSMISISILTLISRLIFMKILAGISITLWLREVILRLAIPTIIIISISSYIQHTMSYGIQRFGLTLLCDVIIVGACTWFIIFSRSERHIVLAKMISFAKY